MMVGYVYNSTTTWKVWDPEFNAVRTQSDVIFDEERNAHIDVYGTSESGGDGDRSDERKERTEIFLW